MLVDGTTLSVAACLLILASVPTDPRRSPQDLPRDMRDAVPLCQCQGRARHESRRLDSRTIAGALLKGTRVTLRTVLATLAEGASVAEILADFPTLTGPDVRAVIAFAATFAEEDPSVTRMRGDRRRVRAVNGNRAQRDAGGLRCAAGAD